MGLQVVDFKCGHSESIQMYGKNTDRDNRAEWMSKNQVCKACHAAELAAKRAEEAKKAAQTADELSLVTLTGSEKQVAWANQIRDTMVKLVLTVKDGAIKAQGFAAINKVTTAKEWIDNRANPRAMLAKYSAAK